MATPVIMPKLEMSQETATVVAWIKQEGDRIKKGEPLLTVETDKVTMDIESPGTGILAGVCAVPDQVVLVTDIIAYLLQPGETLPDTVPTSVLPVGEGALLQRSEGQRTGVATPVARRIAAEHGVNLDTIAGTGPGGRVSKADVEAVLTAPVDLSAEVPPGKVRATPAARRIARDRSLDLLAVAGSGPRDRVQAADVLAYTPPEIIAGEIDVEVVPLQGMRRTIAERMQHSYQTAPHITLTVEVDMSAAQALRAELNAHAEALSVPRISVTAILTKVCAWALQRHRWVNASLHGQDIHLHRASNIGVAVALKEGLIVPVVHDAERMGIAAIAARIQDLVVRARDGCLVSADVSGGTFTISNLGMYGIDHFTAILNPPESAILAVGRMVKRSIVVEREGRDEALIRPMMNMTLSADHRVIDGAVAARFVRDVVDALEHPNLLLW